MWPLLLSVSLFSLLTRTLIWMRSKATTVSLVLPFIRVILVSLLWWKDLGRERILGYHTHKLEVSLRLAFRLFILSEVFFFVSFFWAFYDASLSPVIELGLAWPPKGIAPLATYSVPLLNTVILLSRGVTITWCHHSALNNFFSRRVFSLAATVLLGAYFLTMQWVEYREAQFSLADGVYGRTFFVATGFHGIHVTVGTLFLFYVLVLFIQAKLTWAHHFSFEAAAWYWHFVDVVWLILFVSIYWWGGL
jgi:cytochrome c oxidase subunit 3